MFNSNNLRQICSTSHEMELRLSDEDWTKVLEANKGFTEQESDERGGAEWGAYLLEKIRCPHMVLQAPLLEVCCGTGFLYFSIEALRSEERNVFVDLSRSQLTAFASRSGLLPGKALPKLIQGDIGSLPFADASLSTVLGNSFLHHLPDVGLYLRELARVLRPGGTLAIFHEPTRTSSFWESFPISLFKDTHTFSLTDIWLIDPRIIAQLLADNGFSDIKIFPSELLFSMLGVPIQIVIRKLSMNANPGVVAHARRWLGIAERLFPEKFMLRYAPSIAIHARR